MNLPCPLRVPRQQAIVILTQVRQISVTDAAKRLGVGRVALSRLRNGTTGVSPEMALRL